MTLACALSVAAPARAAEWFVDPAICPAPGSGTAADPYCSLQVAVDAAKAGDTVSVAAGTLTGTTLRAIDIDGTSDQIAAVLFLRNGVAVRGAGRGVTILDAGGAATGVVADRCDAASLSGVTIAGAGPGSGAGFDFGDGLLINGGSPVFDGLEITGTEGGFAAVDILGASAAEVRRTILQDNGLTTPIEAALLVTLGASPRFEACEIRDNRGTAAGGLFASGSTFVLADSVVAGNLGQSGGAIRLSDVPSGSIRGCTVAGNTSSVAGAGIRLESSSAAVTGCVVASNRSLTGQVGGLFADGASAMTVAFTDAHGNVDADYQTRSDPTGTNGNISQDPGFRDLVSLDMRLQEGSPAIDAAGPPSPGVDLTGAIRPLDGDRDGVAAPDMGAYEFDLYDVRGLGVENPPFRLVWSALPESVGYQVQRGALENLALGDYGDCLTAAGDLSDTRFDDPASPAAGNGWFYIVTARVGGTIGTLGFDSRGLERIRRAGAACP